ncbi:G-alpha-domain-containing protein [Cristinia sonorae]|uniref:G-alpha-domain-containing protein n=1 Tax=Cristinia sonorae TaxID=1940300 RepID=A0A8K0UYM8_9AGAR|nr:G-alpha-domain-containing protein [Cristinia sonorae]
MTSTTPRGRWDSCATKASSAPLRPFATNWTLRSKAPSDDLEPHNEWPPPPPEDESALERALRLEAEEKARKQSEEIDAAIDQDKTELERRRRQKKVLLLGQSQSGKSTLLKSFQLLYAPRAFRAEAEAWRAVIYLNLVHSVNILLDVVDAANLRTSKTIRHLQISLSPLRQVRTALTNTLSTENARARLSVEDLDVEVWRARRASGISVHSSAWRSLAKVSGPGNASQDDIENARSVIGACRNDIAAIWSNKDVRECLSNQAIELDSQAVYFLDEAQRISAADYCPTDDDILRARLETVGVEEHSIVFENVDRGQEWIWYDIEGTRSSRAAWVPYFDDVHIVMFVCSIANFDDELDELSGNNFMECLRLWKSICENKLLANTTFFLFLNKWDLLEKKLKSGTFFGAYVPEFGHRSNDWQSVANFYREKYLTIHRDFSPQSRLLQVHITCAIDTIAMRGILEQARHEILTVSIDRMTLL